MKGDGTKCVKSESVVGYTSYGFGNTPTPSKVPLQPKHMGKSFWFRLKEWLTA